MKSFFKKLKSAASAVGSFFSNAASVIKDAAIRVHGWLGTRGVIAAVIAVAATVAVMLIDPASVAIVIGCVIFAFNIGRVASPSFWQGALMLFQSLAMGVLVAFLPLLAVGLVAYICVTYRAIDMNPSHAWRDFWNLQMVKNEDSPLLEGLWVLMLGWINTTADILFLPAIMKTLNDDGYSLRSNGLFHQRFVFTTF